MAQAPTLKRSSTTGGGGALLASVPSGDFTVAGWFQVAAAVGTYNTKICVTTAADAATFAWLGVSSLSVQAYTPTTGFSAAMTTVAVGDWIYCAITRTGSTIGARVAKNGVATLYSAALVNAATPARINLLQGNSTGLDCSSAAVDLVRVWSAVLSDAEILAEMASTDPVRWTGLWSFATLADSTLGVVDRSGAGRAWTVTALTAGTANAYRTAWDTSLAGSAQARSAAAGAITTQVQLAGAAQARSSAAAALTTTIALSGSAGAVAALSGLLISAGLGGTASARAALIADLTTAIELAGSAEARSTASATLGTAVQLSGAAAARSSQAAALSTQVLLAGSAAARAAAAPALSTQITLAGSVVARASFAPTTLVTSIRFAGTAAARAWFDPSAPSYLPARYSFSVPARPTTTASRAAPVRPTGRAAQVATFERPAAAPLISHAS